MLSSGKRFAYTKTWTIDVNDYGAQYHEIYHVVKSTPKSLLLLSATLFRGDINVEGNELMDKVVEAWTSGSFLLNQNTMPRRVMLKKDKQHGCDYFIEGKGTATRRIRLGGPNAVTYLETSFNSPDLSVAKSKRMRTE